MKKLVVIMIIILLRNITLAQNKFENKITDSITTTPVSVSDNSSSTSLVTDIDGNIYKTITIGSQTWMQENLKVTRFSNGDEIKTTSPATLNLDSLVTPKYQWAYMGDEKNVPTYGRLYTWYVVTDSRNVCPTGWHVPTKEEFCILENSIEPGSDTYCNIHGHRGNNQGGYMKSAGIKYWREPNTGADNRSGFFVLPAGTRTSNGGFHYLGSHGHIWTSTEFESDRGMGLAFRFYYDSKDVSRTAYFKASSMSVRCIKN